MLLLIVCLTAIHRAVFGSDLPSEPSPPYIASERLLIPLSKTPFDLKRAIQDLHETGVAMIPMFDPVMLSEIRQAIDDVVETALLSKRRISACH
jgi:hypothetical protein